VENECEVPSPHENEIEKATEKGHDWLTQKIALMTAILATVEALIAIALGAITLLTKRRWLRWGSDAAAALGINTSATSFLWGLGTAIGDKICAQV
jgi:hypothetical protein